jgi:hypothetical protein
MIIVHNMRFLLLNDPVEVARSTDRVAVGLTIQQDENTGGAGENCQDKAQAAQCLDKLHQALENEEGGQQEHAYNSGEFSGWTPFERECVAGVGSCDPGYL